MRKPACLEIVAQSYYKRCECVFGGNADARLRLFLSATPLSAQDVDVLSRLVKEKSNLLLAGALIVVFALTRLPNMLPLNFSAAYALAFCAGVYLPRRAAWWLPVSIMLVTDILLNVFYYRVAAVGWYMVANYLSYAAIIWLGQKFSARASWLKLVGGGLLGAILFYLVTNTISWWQNPVYPKTLTGWIQALTTGQPGFPPTWMFFGNSLWSSGLFTGLFVGAMKVSKKMEAEEKEDAAETAEEPPEGAPPEESKA